ncbi:hypothetical protein [Klebsiella pneumoniae]|uniref:hypothetical protein n=1 Tax=Klebsiella pneumoniae TaxID=573 RepID=UPI00294A02F3|nr:hypothetical protein [Klebsiella pneumoniae]MDV5728064.1 hypothetical protein [Klebsiella pneumoniae]
MDIKSIAIAAILGAAGGFGGSYYVMSEQTASIHQRLNQTPPVVVVDFASGVGVSAGASGEVERLMVKTNDAILKLKDAGYLVLDASAVVGAPSDVYLPDEVLK